MTFYSLPRSAAIVLLALAILPVASAQWNESVLYSFQGGTDGQWPIGRVVFDSGGNLYGTTITGGTTQECLPVAECGTVYQLAPPAFPGAPWTETILYVFKGNAFNDGATPAGGLVMDDAGNLYGTTGYGGTGDCALLGIKGGCGSVYELSPPSEPGGAWTEQVLYSFSRYSDGYFPTGDLVFDRAGNLYGATQFGGGRGTNCGNAFYPYCGTIFKLSPPKQPGGAWTHQLLHSFSGVPFGALTGDGANPNGGLAIDTQGNVYGTTQIGGFACYGKKTPGCGTVFELSPPKKPGQPWAETIIYRFTGDDGADPAAGLIFDATGNLFGTTVSGGNKRSEDGIVFRLSPQRSGLWTNSVLYRFSGSNDGGAPRSSVALYGKDTLYGTTTYLGAGRRGTLFELQPVPTNIRANFQVVHDFTGQPDGSYPASPLTLDALGNIYGTTQQGGIGACDAGCGTLFLMSH